MAEENASPISAMKPPVTNPISSPTSHHASTLKLKPVIRKPAIGGGVARPGIKLPAGVNAAPATAATSSANEVSASTATSQAAASTPSSLDQLRGATQKLKGLTQQIPQQAILHKTGIIAEEALTEAQKMASKSRTARISLSDAIGVAPVKNEPVPMKTIRIKRPVGIGESPSSTPVAPASKLPVAKPAAPAASETAVAPAEAPAEAKGNEASAEAVSLTQRKTLKIARPGAQIRPSGKFGLKKPAAPAAPKESNAVNSDEVADIPDIPDIPAKAPNVIAEAAECPPNAIPDVPPACRLIGLLVQIAACAVIAFLVWDLYGVVKLPAYFGGTIF